MKEKEYDIFVNQNTYPDPTNIFSLKLAPVDEIISKCVIVLDTNALLVPYSTGSESLSEIERVFQKMKQEERLIVPGQVAREFANNRPEKLKDLYQQLNRKLNKTGKIEIGNYPLLEGITEYQSAKELEEKINEQLSEYKKSIKSLKNKVKSWNWNDPVSEIYRQIFTGNTILDLKIEEEKTKKDLEYRYAHKIPPGFKDGNKEDSGVGDFLIWKTILEIGKEEKDVIFVSGDEKSDWYHRSENEGLYPRFELLNEFYAKSKGKSFHILRLSELLKLLGASENIVSEIAREETLPESSFNNFIEFSKMAETAIAYWFSQKDNCKVIHNPSFPDFKLECNNGIKSGIEVITFKGDSNVRMRYPELLNRLTKAEILFNEKKYDSFYFVFVTQSKNYAWDLFKSSISKTIEEYVLSIEINLIFGFLDEDGRFIRME